MNVVKKAKDQLRQAFAGVTDDKGYTSLPRENLVPDIDWGPIQIDLQRGDGGELRQKFNAVHSSAALAVNSFGPFKSHPERLLLFGKRGWKGSGV